MSDPASPVHVPVLLGAVLAAASGSRRVVDATLGDGGHAAALLAAGAELLGIDRDPQAIAGSRRRLGEHGVRYLEAPYADPQSLFEVSAFHPGFILLDLGVSSRQLDETGRGFTFRPGAPLDMRMGRRGWTAAAFLNESAEGELERIFRAYGDERRARRLAREIVRRREHRPFTSSDDLVNAIRAVLGARAGPPEFARLFQAVRIAVNDELEGLALALPAFRDALTPGGRLAVITYHSGEDRLVKQAFREWATACICVGGVITANGDLGDSVVGKQVNVGAGTVTCNYDGANKHATHIDDGAFIGSGSMLVAPVRIGAGATIGAGSTITRDAPAAQLTLARARQASLPAWKRPIKKNSA